MSALRFSASETTSRYIPLVMKRFKSFAKTNTRIKRTEKEKKRKKEKYKKKRDNDEGGG